MTRCYFPYAAARIKVAQSNSILTECLLRFVVVEANYYSQSMCVSGTPMNVMFRIRPKFQQQPIHGLDFKRPYSSTLNRKSKLLSESVKPSQVTVN